MTASKPCQPASEGDYQVGYGKPPKAGQFQPGKSGNPNDRPKGRPCLYEVIREEAARIAKVKVGDKIEHIDKDHAAMRRLFALGLQGNVAALRYAMSLLAQAQAALVETADPEAPLNEEELAVLTLMSKTSGAKAP